MMKPCIPPELQAVADEAERRKTAAIERLAAIAVDLGALEEPPDPFLRSMADLIEADKRVVIQMKGRRRA
jgi:hypothetical protein